MPEYIQLPDGSHFEVKKGETPMQAFLAAKQQYPELFPDERASKKPEYGFGSAFSASLSRLGGEAALTAGKAGFVDEAKAEEFYRQQKAKAEQIHKPTEKGWLEDPWQKIKETAGESAAYMLVPAAAGLGALLLPEAAAAAPVLGGLATLGGATGAGLAGLAGVGQYTGSNLAAQMEAGKKSLAEASGAAALGAAVPQAALDVFGLRMIPGIGKIFGAAGVKITEEEANRIAQQGLRKVAADYALATGKTMGAEGFTEAAQQVFERLQAGLNLTDEDARKDYLENFIGGAALAGVLGPFGRAAERGQIRAEGKRLEAERLTKEKKTALQAQQEAADKEAMQQYGTLFPELGPVEAITAKPENAQRRLAEIENEVETARQARDTDALLRLHRERTQLEDQLAKEPTEAQKAFEARREADLRVQMLQRQAEQYQEAVKAAPSIAEKQAAAQKLADIQEQLRSAQEDLEKFPAPKTYEGLLKREKAVQSALKKAVEEGDGAQQAKLYGQLQTLQDQLGLFGSEAFANKARYEQGELDFSAEIERRRQESAAQRQKLADEIEALQKLRENAKGPEYARLAAEEARLKRLQAQMEAGRMPGAETGVTEQYELFGPTTGEPAKPGTLTRTHARMGEPGLPAIQQQIAQLSERQDLSDEDRALLEEVKGIATQPAGVATVEQQRAIQAKLEQIQEQRSQLRKQAGLSDIPSKFWKYVEDVLQRKLKQTTRKQDTPANAEYSALLDRVAELQDKLQTIEAPAAAHEKQLATLLAEINRVAKKQGDKSPISLPEVLEYAGANSLRDISASLRQAIPAQYREAYTQLGETERQLRAQESRMGWRSSLKEDGLEKRRAIAAEIGRIHEMRTTAEAQFGAQAPKTLALAQREQVLQRQLDEATQPPLLAKLTTPLETRIQEVGPGAEAVTSRATPVQRVSDWLSDLSRGVDTTQSRAALQDTLRAIREAQMSETEVRKEPVTRLTTPEQERITGKTTYTAMAPSPLGTTAEAQQPDLFADTEFARSKEFERPSQFQKFLASDAVKKMREKLGLLRPTAAFLNARIDRLNSQINTLKQRVNNYKLLAETAEEGKKARLTNAKLKLSEVTQAIELSIHKAWDKYLRARLKLREAQETYVGLLEFAKAAQDALTSALEGDASYNRIYAKYKVQIEEKQRELDSALQSLDDVRKHVAEQLEEVDVAAVSEPREDLVAMYHKAQEDVQKALTNLSSTVQTRENIKPPVNFVVTERELQQALIQDAIHTEMLIAQSEVVQKWQVALNKAQAGLSTARSAAENDPTWAHFLGEARAGLRAAEETVEPVTRPVALESAIAAANRMIRGLRTELRALETASAEARRTERKAGERREREAKQAVVHRERKAEQQRLEESAAANETVKFSQQDDVLSLLNTRQAKQALEDIAYEPVESEKHTKAKEYLTELKARIEELEKGQANKLEKLIEALDARNAELDAVEADPKFNTLTKTEEKAVKKDPTARKKFLAEREKKKQKKLASVEAKHKKRIDRAQADLLKNYAKPVRKTELSFAPGNLSATQKLVQEAINIQESLTKVADKLESINKALLEPNNAQNAELKKQKQELTQRKRTLAKKSVAIKEQVEKTANQSAAEPTYTLNFAEIRDIALGKTTRAETVANKRAAAQKVAIYEMQEDVLGGRNADEIKRQKEVEEARKQGVSVEPENEVERIAQTQTKKRTGQTVVHVRTGRVSEAPKTPQTQTAQGARSITKQEMSEANTIAKSMQPVVEETNDKHYRALVRFAKQEFDEDLGAVYSPMEVDALELAILERQAQAIEDAKLRQKGGAKFDEAAAVAAAKQVYPDPLYRLLSHDYETRENTALDAATAAAVNKGNTRATLESLAKNGSTPFVRMMAQHLLPFVENTNLETAALEGKGGEYDQNTDTAILNKNALTEEDTIHELGHAATVKVLDASADTLTAEQLAARTALEKLYAKMQGRTEFAREYGNVSLKEFVSELLSNKQVRDKINQTAGLLRRIYEGFMRMLGIEPKTLSDKAVEQAIAIFTPSGVSATETERLASIMRGTFPGSQAQYSPNVNKDVIDTINRTVARSVTLGDRIASLGMGMRWRTLLADNWAPAEGLLRKGVKEGKIKEAQALQQRYNMRILGSTQEFVNSALINGVSTLVKTDEGTRVLGGGDPKKSVKAVAEALKKANVGNDRATEALFTTWLAILRAERAGVGYDKLNFETPITAEQAQAVKDQVANDPKTKAAFEEARRIYREFNKSLLDLAVESGVVDADVAREWLDGDFVPFYRANKNGVVEIEIAGSRPVRIGNLIDHPYLKELVGGKQHILPFFSGAVQNTSLLTRMSLQNMQTKSTANMIQDLELGKVMKAPEGRSPPENAVKFKSKGEDYWLALDKDAFPSDIPADLFIQGLQGIKTTVPALVRGMAMPANLLRKTVRRMPLYTVRQTIRDPLHAWMTTGGNFTPIFSTWGEMYKAMQGKSATHTALKEAGAISSHVFSGDPDSVADMLRKVSGNPGIFNSAMAKLDEFAMHGEAATRAVLYDKFRKQGMSHTEALLYTVETMNFSRRGTSASVHFLAQMIPFFNAQIQGLDAVYRALRKDSTMEERLAVRRKLLTGGAIMAGMTVAYALMMQDDEAYKNATPEERYGNWFVPVPGTDKTLRVPIPFELGIIFKAVPEMFVNTMVGDTKAKDAAKVLAKMVMLTSPVSTSSIPTAIKGPFELLTNTDFYSGQPIESAHEQGLTVDQRYRSSTTEFAKLLGKAGILSPVQIDHLIRSYTSGMGIMLASMANYPLHSTAGTVEAPEKSLEELPLIGAAFQPRSGRGIVNAVFDDIKQYQQAANTYKALAASDPAAAKEFADKFSRDIANNRIGGAFREQMGEFAAYKRMIAASPSLTPAEKRAKIDEIKTKEIEYAKRVRQMAAA